MQNSCNGCGHQTTDECKNIEFCKVAQQKKEARKQEEGGSPHWKKGFADNVIAELRRAPTLGEHLIEHKVIPKKYDGLHPAFISLLLRLANPAYSIQECVQERLDWHHYGCPVYKLDKTRGE